MPRNRTVSREDWIKAQRAPEEVAGGRVDYNFGTIATDRRYHSEELSGISVFFKEEDGAVFLTQSIYARGLDLLMGAGHDLDITPKGRNEAEYTGWLRRHDEYARAHGR